MVRGLVMFGNGLYDATHQRAAEQRISIDEAFENEVAEMESFLRELVRVSRTNGDSSNGDMTTMIHGIAIFVAKLFESTLARAHKEGKPLSATFKRRLRDMGRFLDALENEHQALKRRYSPRQTIARTVKWIRKQEKGSKSKVR